MERIAAETLGLGDFVDLKGDNVAKIEWDDPCTVCPAEGYCAACHGEGRQTFTGHNLYWEGQGYLYRIDEIEVRVGWVSTRMHPDNTDERRVSWPVGTLVQRSGKDVNWHKRARNAGWEHNTGA